MGGGEASAAQEPQPDQEDDIREASEPIPSEPFIVETSSAIPQKDAATVTPQVTPQPPPEATTSALDLSSPQLDFQVLLYYSVGDGSCWNPGVVG